MPNMKNITAQAQLKTESCYTDRLRLERRFENKQQQRNYCCLYICLACDWTFHKSRSRKNRSTVVDHDTVQISADMNRDVHTKDNFAQDWALEPKIAWTDTVVR